MNEHISVISVISFSKGRALSIQGYAKEHNLNYIDIYGSELSDIVINIDSEFYFFASDQDFDSAFKTLKEILNHLPIINKVIVFLEKYTITEREEFEKLGIDIILPLDYLFRPSNIVIFLLRKYNEEQFKNKIVQSQLAQSIYNQKELNKIGVALSSEHNLDRLLSIILAESRSITNSDSGSIYIVDESAIDPNKRELRFKVTQNDSVNVFMEEFKLPISEKSIAGYVCLSGEPLNIDDAYHLPETSTFAINKDFDSGNNYRTKSMLTIPMKNRDQEVTGIIQLINKKTGKEARITPQNIHENVSTYSSDDINIMYSIASQAAVSIEKAKLYQEIESLFENFIESIVTAIDRRDKVTAGHSLRIAGYAVATAKAMNMQKDGPFKDVFFNEWELKELKYAALLHDVGKIGVREDVLNKEKRLLHGELPYITEKIKYSSLKATIRDFCELKELDRNACDERINTLKKEVLAQIEKINQINSKDKLTDDDISYVEKISRIFYKDVDDSEKLLLNDHEKENLSIRYGTLNQNERKEIEAHMVYTDDILSKINWMKELKNVPKIAVAHHEKLDGSGYPKKLKGNEIPLGGKILAVVDIYEALTAFDRPYKPPLSYEIAIKILYEEAERNKLDKNIVDLFVKEKIYNEVSK